MGVLREGRDAREGVSRKDVPEIAKIAAQCRRATERLARIDTESPERRAAIHRLMGRLAVVVDDDALVLESLQALLTAWGYEVLTATATDQTVARTQERSRRPDIVIADYRLQDGRTGTEAIRAVRALFDQTVPGVILSGETDLDFLRTAAGHDVGIAHKPVTPPQLGRVLDQQLRAAA